MALGDKANALYEKLIQGEEVTFPTIDTDALIIEPEGEDGPLSQPINRVDNCALTSGSVEGNGVLDLLISTVKEHLHVELKAQRISATDYARTLSELIGVAMSNAVQFLSVRDQTYWAAVVAKYQARAAYINQFTARAELQRVFYGMLTEKSQFTLHKMQALNVGLDIDTKEYVLQNDMPVQTDILEFQRTGADLANDGQTIQNNTSAYNLAEILPKQASLLNKEVGTAEFNLTEILPRQADMLTEQISLEQKRITDLGLDTTMKQHQYEFDMPHQTQILGLQKIAAELQNQGLDIQNQTADFQLEGILYKQSNLLQEQIESQRAQTSDTRTDGATVTGSVGVQKDLYRQQIDSYQRDSELKAARLFSDAWITQKTIDEGITPPGAFSNASVDAVLSTIRSKNGL